MNQLILSLGSNIESRSLNITNACQAIAREIGKISNASKIYTTPPLGFESDTHFLNCCILVETRLTPIGVLSATQKIEQSLGRTQKSLDENYTSRTIDIDIIFFNKQRVNTSELIIPHALFRERKFVLKPLNDLTNNYIDPISQLTVGQLLINCNDNSPIAIHENQFLDTLYN
ncbi:MAG: 2-amino-4-hydroxy-6-hydroxymethyldihydropteridine diphosphokinase [Crocinitomicaceae bacterium]|nr:2-amino-4-hydroxy-6-hydroxymethyldihydropteridine diphosphokinase [Crocinitomicaceae bacterium]